jgi:hypothetical protein
VVATHGRSFWILDYLTQLRQLADGATDGAAQLLKPRDTVRLRIEQGYGNDPTTEYTNYANSGTSVVAYAQRNSASGEDEKIYLNAGANPPNGVTLTYFLPERPTDKITLEILDAKGEVARTFTSRPEKPESSAERPAGEGAEPSTAAAQESEEDQEPAVPTLAGFNRFTWDLRYAGPTPVKGQELSPWEKPAGPLAVPGKYQARLTVGGQESTQSFEVLPDTRISATKKDLQAQFDLYSKVSAKLSEVNAAIGKTRDIREQVEAWEKRAKGQEGMATALSAAKALKDAVTAVEEQLIDTHPKSPLMFPARLNEKLSALLGFVESADYAPPKQAQEVFKELSSNADAQLKQLQAVIDTQVAAFNKAVAEAGLQAVTG